MKLKILGITTILFSFAAAAQAAEMKEGQWEYTMKMDMPGMPQMPPGMQLPPGMKIPGMGGEGYTVKQCVTKDKAVPPQKDSKDMKCEMTKQERKGDTFKWASHCTGKSGEIDSEGTAVYSGDTMTSEMKTHGTMDGHPADMTMKTTGKYLGPCPAQ